jgi:TonB family protein
VSGSGLLSGLFAAAFLLAAPAAAIPPALGPPEPFHPFTFAEWTGTCGERTTCGAKLVWGQSSIVIGFEPAQPYPPWERPAVISYTLYRLCEGRNADVRGSLTLPLAGEGDVAAHLRTAIQNEPNPCGGPLLDEATAASITRLVRMFTLLGGIAPPLREGQPGDTDYNRHPLNPDVWIDEVRDYPESAKERRQGGRVAAQLTIRDDLGKAVLCNVTESSGVAALDEATCKLLLRNARFRVEPKPAISHYTHRVSWDIGAIPVPFCVLCEIGPDGVRRPQQFDQQGRRIRRPGHHDEKPQR